MDESVEGSISQKDAVMGVEVAELPGSQKITKEQFEAKREKNGNIGFGFFLIRADEGQKQPCIAVFDSTKNGVEVKATVPESILPYITAEQKEKFDISQDGLHISFPKKEVTQSADEQKLPQEHDDATYTIDGMRRRNFGDRSATQLSIQNFSDHISQIDNEGLVFYTGAGISHGGEAAVWNIADLQRELHLEGTKFPDPRGALNTFMPAFLSAPEEIVQKFDQFVNQCQDDVSTPAHEAISQILSKKPGAAILTENVDLKHEAEGSRRAAIHMNSSKESFDLVKKRADVAKLLVTVGLGSDDRAVIAYMKEKNPNLKIVALALPPESPDQIPSFLQNDFAVYGDCQQILPEVAKMLGNVEQHDTI